MSVDNSLGQSYQRLQPLQSGGDWYLGFKMCVWQRAGVRACVLSCIPRHRGDPAPIPGRAELPLVSLLQVRPLPYVADDVVSFSTPRTS